LPVSQVRAAIGTRGRKAKHQIMAKEDAGAQLGKTFVPIKQMALMASNIASPMI